MLEAIQRILFKHFYQILNLQKLKESVLQQNDETRKQILPFVTQYKPSVPNLKHALMGKLHLIQNQPFLRQSYFTTHSFKKRKKT